MLPLLGHRDDVAAAIDYFEKALAAQPDHMLAAHGKKLMEEMQAENGRKLIKSIMKGGERIFESTTCFRFIC